MKNNLLTNRQQRGCTWESRNFWANFASSKQQFPEKYVLIPWGCDKCHLDTPRHIDDVHILICVSKYQFEITWASGHPLTSWPSPSCFWRSSSEKRRSEQLFHKDSISAELSLKALLCHTKALSFSWSIQLKKRIRLYPDVWHQQHCKSLQSFIHFKQTFLKIVLYIVRWWSAYLWQVGDKLGISKRFVVTHVGIEPCSVYQNSLVAKR